MSRYGLLPVWFAALVALAGCSTAQTQALLTDLQGCERHYNGVVSAGTSVSGAAFSGSVKIDCPHAEAPSAVATLPPAR